MLPDTDASVGRRTTVLPEITTVVPAFVGVGLFPELKDSGTVVCGGETEANGVSTTVIGGT